MRPLLPSEYQPEVPSGGILGMRDVGDIGSLKQNSWCACCKHGQYRQPSDFAVSRDSWRKGPKMEKSLVCWGLERHWGEGMKPRM